MHLEAFTMIGPGRALTMVLAVAAIGITVVALAERQPRRVEARRIPPPTVRRMPEWRALVDSVAIPLDAEDGSIVVATFTDYRCVFCRRLDSSLAVFAKEREASIRRLVIPFPLDGDPVAFDAVRHVECARRIGDARRVHMLLYRNQERLTRALLEGIADSLGLLEPQRSLLTACLRDASSMSRIRHAIAEGRRVGIRGTPSVVVNGSLITPARYEDVVRVLASAAGAYR